MPKGVVPEPGEQAADSGSLVRYLETFAHTVGVMQTAPALRRVARESVLDLARAVGHVAPAGTSAAQEIEPSSLRLSGTRSL